MPVENSQVAHQIQERPLRTHIFDSPDGPAPKSVVLFDLSEMTFNDLSALFELLLGWGLSQLCAHLLHGRGMTPNLDDSAPFGILTQLGHRAVRHVTTILLDDLSLLEGLSAKIQ